MNVCILMGSPRKGGNTASLLAPFVAELEAAGCHCTQTHLHERDVRPCIACRACQKDWSIFGCPQQDDMQGIFDDILACDLLVFATPIYSWYCTPPLKAVMDRLMYGMNKYYGQELGPSLWRGKRLALLTTCGYRPEAGADLWEVGIKRYCKHSNLEYLGMLTERHLGYKSVFMDEEKADHARAFAGQLCATK